MQASASDNSVERVRGLVRRHTSSLLIGLSKANSDGRSTRRSADCPAAALNASADNQNYETLIAVMMTMMMMMVVLMVMMMVVMMAVISY